MSKFLAIFALLLAPVFAQEGHPMTGTWHGTFGPNAKSRTDVTMVLTWDGKQISGLVNPGPEQPGKDKHSPDSDSPSFCRFNKRHCTHLQQPCRAAVSSPILYSAKSRAIVSKKRKNMLTVTGVLVDGPPGNQRSRVHPNQSNPFVIVRSLSVQLTRTQTLGSLEVIRKS